MPSTRPLLIAIALTCFALIGAALYLQHFKDMFPCPLCVIQRYAFLAAGIFALVGAFVVKRTPWIALALLSALGGVGTVAKHLYVLANPGFECGIDPTQTFLNQLPTATLLPSVFEANGICSDAGDPILGLSIPAWSAIWLVAVTAALVVALVRRAK